MPKLYAMSSTLGDVKQDLILLLAGADIGDASMDVDTFAEDIWGRLRGANLTANAMALSLTQQRTLDTESLKMLREDLRLMVEPVVPPVKLDKDILKWVRQEKVERILTCLVKSLKLKTMTRFKVYNTFVDQWVQRGIVAKLSSSKIKLSRPAIALEGWAFMKRLACYLVERGLSKVRYDHRSLLFSKQTASDEFFGSDDADGRADLRSLIRGIIPLRIEDSDYSFIHKSVLEFLVAAAVKDDLLICVKAPNLDLASLLLILESLGSGKSLEVCVEQELQARSNVENEGAKPAAAVVRRIVAATHTLVAELAHGSFGTLDLAQEEAVRDFIVDTMQSDPEVCTALEVAVAVCVAQSLHGDAEVSGRLRTVHENIVAVVARGNIKRRSGNALHVAAHDGNLGMLASVGRVLAHPLVKGAGAAPLKDALNTHGHTPDGTLAVMVAAEGGEPQVSLSISSRLIQCISDYCVGWSHGAPDCKCA